MADNTESTTLETPEPKAPPTVRFQRPSWHGPSLHGVPIHQDLPGSLHRGISIHGNISSKVTASDKQRILDDKKKSIFLPWSKLYRAWWTFMVLATIFTVFFETHYIAFGRAGFTPYGSKTAIIEYCLVSVFLIDIFVNFNLAYLDEKEGMVVYDRKSIARHYLKLFFWIDLIGIFPFYIIALAITGQVGKDSRLAQYLALLRLSRFVRMHRIKELFRLLQYNSRVSFMWLTLTRNFVMALIWSHVAACIMYFIARQYSFSEITFLGSKLDVYALSDFERYIVALYWSVVSFSSVGYGDYSAGNVHEQIFSILYLLVSVIILAWILGSMTLLVVKGDKKTGVFREALNALHQYSVLNDFDKAFEKNLRAQLKAEFDNLEVADEQVLGQYPSSVRAKLLRKLYLRPLIRTSLMKGVRQQFINDFLTSCIVEVYHPGEEIIQRGSIASELYLLVGGTVKVLPWDSGDKSENNEGSGGGGDAAGTLLEPGSFVNEIGFFTESPQLDTVRTLTVCKFLTMSRSIYKAIANDHPGSINIILNNLLDKVNEAANEAMLTPQVKLTKRIELLNAGSVYDDYEDPSYHNTVKQAAAALQTQTSLTAVKDLVQMHMNKLKDDQTMRFLFAASRDDVATIALMCEHGFDPNMADYDSRTALMVASMKGNIPAVKKLLECHANPNLIDMHGSSALLEATRCGHSEIVEELVKHGADLCMSESKAASTLCQAVFDGDVVLLRRLLQAGINVNAADYDKRTAAHISAAEGNVAAMKVLVEFGADLTLEDRWHYTIDDEAQRSHCGPMLSFLGNLKSSVQTQTSNEESKEEEVEE